MTKPAVCVSSSRTRIFGESSVGYSRAFSSGTYVSAGASSDSFPSSRSRRIESAVNALVIDAMRKSVSGVTGRFASISCTPAPFTCTSFPSFTTPHTMPGMCASSR